MKQYIGNLCVYRDGMHRNTLSAILKLEDGQSLYWDRCPKCFLQLIDNGHNNMVKISLKLNDELQNPRQVTVIGQPY